MVKIDKNLKKDIVNCGVDLLTLISSYGYSLIVGECENLGYVQNNNTKDPNFFNLNSTDNQGLLTGIYEYAMQGVDNSELKEICDEIKKDINVEDVKYAVETSFTKFITIQFKPIGEFLMGCI